jgi:hypothetical protein
MKDLTAKADAKIDFEATALAAVNDLWTSASNTSVWTGAVIAFTLQNYFIILSELERTLCCRRILQCLDCCFGPAFVVSQRHVRTSFTFGLLCTWVLRIRLLDRLEEGYDMS